VYVAVQTATVTLCERELPAPPEAPEGPEGPEGPYLSVDGAMVPLVGGVWAEVRTLALGAVVVREVQTRHERDRTVHAQDLSYFSRLADHETFTRLATVDTQRRGTETAGGVCAVVDRASWIQDFIAWRRPNAVRILDWPHALGYVARVATASYGAETAADYRAETAAAPMAIVAATATTGDATSWARASIPRRPPCAPCPGTAST